MNNWTENPEMVMDAFRLARSGNYKTLPQIKKAFKEMYPDATQEQVSKTFSKLADILRGSA